MCINPNVVQSGVSVPCRKCWQCAQNRVNDWVGRNIAESRTAVACHSITLTYGRDEDGQVDHLRAALLTYSDVQKYFKKLRFHGYPCRYFVAGEYGSLKGRAHWHLMLYWLKQAPPHELRQNFDHKFWTHGHAFFDEVDAPSVRYACKYIQKDLASAERQGLFQMSRKPPLGAQYFEELAQRYVEQGLAPQKPYYSFADVTDQRELEQLGPGKPTQFYMRGRTLDNFCAAFLERWNLTYGGHPPNSPMLDEYEDRLARLAARPELRPEAWKPRCAYPWIEPPNGGSIRFSETHNAYCVDDGAGGSLYWSFNPNGERSWERKIVTETAAELMRSRLQLSGATKSAARSSSKPSKNGSRLS